MTDFQFARQRAKRVLLFWLAAILITTAAVAAAAWTVGSHLSEFI